MTETPVQDDIDMIDEADEADEAEPWLVRRPRLMGKLSWTLLALLVAAAGFAAGASLKNPAPASPNATASGAARAFAGFGTANGAGGGRLGGGTAGSTPAASDATVGQVKLIDGENVYVQTSAGVVVKIATSPTTAIEISNPGALSDVHVGDTLSATGSAGADGTVAATSISRTAASADAAGASTPSPTTPGGQG
jgi:hypothetical protein